MMTIETVRNVPAYAAARRWWVAREADGDLWFYGAYDTAERAREVAAAVDGIPVENPAA